jgi:Methyltransferase domain
MVTARSKFQLIRRDTETFLPGLSPESFDFIYIDGDHKFDKVLSDIKNAKRLIKSEFGSICGDDLEQLSTTALVDLARQYKDQDYLREPHSFNPGVLLTVAQEFDQVSMVNGFWSIVLRRAYLRMLN